MKYSHSLSSLDDVVVDIDQSGLMANSKTYEFADKGYFSNKRGKKGYKLSAAFKGKHSETLDFYFDPGNTLPGPVKGPTRLYNPKVLRKTERRKTNRQG